MSMSTLGQQLAAINQGPIGGRNIGSSYKTSRKHEDAIGRGIQHSVQVGHSLAGNKSHLYKPSIIYEDSKKAADVPLSTIRENCIASLRVLEEIDPVYGKFVNALCKLNIQERGLLTSLENDKIDKSIEELLFRLSLRMYTTTGSGGGRKNILASCLHVIEYLLRIYDIHIRPNMACTLLVVMLPHHEEPYFLRLLQLVDLANLPEYTFLRPYAIPNARLSRNIIAQQTSKDLSLVRAVCKLSQQNAKLPCCEHSLSFTAAVLVEALTIQTRRKGTIDERTLQALLPYIVSACRNNSKNNYKDVWQNWGYIMASTIVDTSVLTMEPRNVLITSVIEGLSTKHDNKRRIPKSNLSNGMMVALTILAQEPPSLNATADEQENNKSSKLPMVSSFGSLSTVSDIYCGYVMNREILSALLKLEGDISVGNFSIDFDKESTSNSTVANCLGLLYRKEGLVDFKHWIASILVVGWKRFVQYGDQQHVKRKNTKSDNSYKIWNLLLALIQQPDLESLWKQSDGLWIQSFTSFLLLNMSLKYEEEKDPDGPSELEHSDNQSKKFQAAKSLLTALSLQHKVAHERGISHALLRTKKREYRVKLAEWLGLAKLRLTDYTVNDDEMGAENDGSTELSHSMTLPPRVALEHADWNVRLSSIPSLIVEAKEANNVGAYVGGESIPQALLRRFSVDDNQHVSLAAARGLEDILVSHSVSYNIDWTELGEVALEALVKWVQGRVGGDEIKAEILCSGLRLASLSARALVESKEQNSMLVRLMEGMGAFMSFSDEKVSQAAARAIIFFWQSEIKSEINDEDKKAAKMLLVSDVTILKGYRRPFSVHDTNDMYIRRHSIAEVLYALTENHTERSAEQSREVIEYCVWIIESFGTNLDDDNFGRLKNCLQTTASFLASRSSNIPSIFRQLASAEQEIFKRAAASYIQTVCCMVKDRKSSNAVAPISVIMEVILSCENKKQIENLLFVAKEAIANTDSGCFFGVAPALALLCNGSEVVRTLALDLLSLLGDVISKDALEDDRKVLSGLCSFFSKTKSTISLGGDSLLSSLLVSLVSTSSDAETLKRLLSRGVLSAAAAYGSKISCSLDQYFEKGWLAPRDVIGGQKTAAILLDAIEQAGESAFPLSYRWNAIGKPLLTAFLSCSGFKGAVRDGWESGYAFDTAHVVVRMLKGAIVVNPNSQESTSKSTIITTGPSLRGGRSRSYSFGKAGGGSFLAPYPSDMQSSVIAILSHREEGLLFQEILLSLIDYVLGRQSWKDEVFSRLSGEARQKIALALLNVISEGRASNADVVFFSLPLDSVDVSELFGGLANRNVEQCSKITYMSDFISSNAASLAADPKAENLFEVIFRHLATLTMETSEDAESIQFAVQSLLSSLSELVDVSLQNMKGKNSVLNKKGKIDGWIGIMVDILVGRESKKAISLSHRMTRTILSILASLCRCHPESGVSKLIPIITGLLTESTLITAGENSLADCFNLAVPVYFEHAASAGLSSADLIQSFISRANKLDESSKLASYRAFLGALTSVSQGKIEEESHAGSFVAAALAGEISREFMGSIADHETSVISQLPMHLIDQLKTDDRILAIWALINYAKEIIFSFLQDEASSISNPIISSQELLQFAIGGGNGDGKEVNSSTQRKLLTMLIVASCDSLMNSEIRTIVRQPLGSKVILRLWQDLLSIQSTCRSQMGGTADSEMQPFLENIVEITGQGLAQIQENLPVHVFLAFVTNIMKDGESDLLRARAVQLIAYRSTTLTFRKADTVLFMEMIPTLLDLLNSTLSVDEDHCESSINLQQSIFSAMESIGRNACLVDQNDMEDSQIDIFFAVLEKASEIIEEGNYFIKEKSFLDLTPSSRQLFSIVFLCASTAIKICGPRSTPALPKLIKALICFQGAVISFLLSFAGNKSDNEKKGQIHVKFMSLSILRCFRTMVQKLPLLLKPYLTALLSGIAQISEILQHHSDSHSHSIRIEMEELQVSIATSIPARVLIPAASKSILSTTNCSSIMSILVPLARSVKSSSSMEVSGQSSSILKITFHCFEKNATVENSDELMDVVNELVLEFILKLSELQLRSLYTAIRDWRSERLLLEPKEADYWKLAFWTLSAVLSKHLKIIFLPCLATVFSDVVEELKCAAEHFCKKDSIKSRDGRKKQKLANESEREVPSLRTLTSLLLCLQSSLHSDARGGGTWIRDTETKRFELLLDPLARLLQCRLPNVDSNRSFDAFVHGEGDGSGSVVGCMVALASAAGDEQLWKPLNHAVLQACSNQTRPEVRKAGVTCLLSLINSIGEEYMVLIPECLPILSELLEDTDEEIAGLTQDCINQSEELLGESLQENLR